MRGRLTALPLAKSRKAVRMASMHSCIGRSRFTSSSVIMMVTRPPQAKIQALDSLRQPGLPCHAAATDKFTSHPGPATLPSARRCKEGTMKDDFEDHCWKDVITPDVLEVYACYKRKTYVGPSAALLAIDLYEVVYRGGPQPPHKLAKSHPNSCGEYAYQAIEPTKKLFAAARGAGLPIFYSTGDAR